MRSACGPAGLASRDPWLALSPAGLTVAIGAHLLLISASAADAWPSLPHFPAADSQAYWNDIPMQERI